MSKKNKIILFVVIILLAVVSVTSFALVNKHRTNKKTDTSVPETDAPDGYIALVEDYFQDFDSRDMEGMLKHYPDEIGEQVKKSYMSMCQGKTEEDYWKLLNEYYGEDFSVSYDLKSAVVLNNSQIKDLENLISSTYACSKKVSYGVLIQVEESCIGKVDSYTGDEFIYAGVVDGKWQLLGNKN